MSATKRPRPEELSSELPDAKVKRDNLNTRVRPFDLDEAMRLWETKAPPAWRRVQSVLGEGVRAVLCTAPPAMPGPPAPGGVERLALETSPESEHLREFLTHTVKERVRARAALVEFYALRSRSPYTSRRLRCVCGVALTCRPYIWRDYETVLPGAHVLHELRQCLGLPRRTAPTLDYVHLSARDLLAVNALLCDTFWPGIDVAESLLAPEHSVVVRWGALVLGAALMTPQGYITYLVVREQWRRLGLASVMLHIMLQGVPDRDVTLHVSVTNHAALLYNRFGFKAEEYVLDFYHKYLPGHSLLSPHALLLRLRR